MAINSNALPSTAPNIPEEGDGALDLPDEGGEDLLPEESGEEPVFDIPEEE